MPARTLALDSLFARRWAAACSLRVRGILARALPAASASLREGVGRPLPSVLPSIELASTVAVSASDLLRRNNGGLCSARGWNNSAESTSLTERLPLSRRVTRMSLWQRFLNIFRSKANKVLDKHEDPRETLDYSTNVSSSC